MVTKKIFPAGDKIERTGIWLPSDRGYMDAGVSPARQTRARHRHELRTLTYVTVDQANGGIVRDINHKGIGMQVVGAVRPQQQLGLRFELRHPRVRVESRGEVTWATRS